jgi:hypothetical protein
MARDVAGAIAREVNIRGDDPSTVASHDLHSDTGTSLETATNIAAVPRQAEWYLRINSCLTRQYSTLDYYLVPRS